MAFDYSTLENQPGIVSPYELNEDQYAATLDPRRGGDLAEGMCTHVPALCGLIHHQIKAIDRIMQNVCNCECKIAKQVSKVITSPPSPPHSGTCVPIYLLTIFNQYIFEDKYETLQLHSYSRYNIPGTGACMNNSMSKPSSWKARKVGLMVIFGLILGVIGVFSDSSSAIAQEKKITAYEVVDRATLKAFVLRGKEYMESLHSVSEIAILRRAFRNEGEWKSGPMFLVTMIYNGYALLHGRDPEADHQDIMDIEDDNGKKVVREFLAAAKQGGGFVEYHDQGVAKVAYAIEFKAVLTDNPFVLVGGWSQDVSRVVTKSSPSPIASPRVTAREVVDRETLKVFVRAAAKAFRDSMMTTGYSEVPRVRTAFRVEGGDWKDGSVYVFVLSDDGFVFFHGDDPFLEGRTVLELEDVNGVKFIQELLAAAERGGGFVEYNWDDPSVKGDEANGSPKLSYTESFHLPGRDQFFIVGAGIYLGGN